MQGPAENKGPAVCCGSFAKAFSLTPRNAAILPALG
jgi:hypothetical protein